MDDNEKLVELPQPKVLGRTRTSPLTLADVDRMSHLFSLATKRWGETLVVHGKLREESFGVPTGTTNLLRLIKEFGSPRELDYLSMSVPGQFILDFDFAKGKLLTKSNSLATLQLLERLWRGVQSEISVSENMLQTVASNEARRFITSCIDKDGNLFEAGDTPVDLAKAHYLVTLNALGLQVLLEKYAAKLVATQNSDGGWGRSKLGESDVLASTSALLILTSTVNESFDKPKAIEKAEVFLLSKRLSDGSWDVNWMRAAGTGLCILALRKSGVRAETLRKSLQFTKHATENEIRESFYDIALIERLKEAGILDAEFIGRLRLAAESSYNEAKQLDTIRLSTGLGLEILQGESIKHRAVSSNALLALRNSDGGWPVRKRGKSELYPTVLALFVLGLSPEQNERGG